LCIKLVNYWDKYTEMHGQQNVKILQLVWETQREYLILRYTNINGGRVFRKLLAANITTELRTLSTFENKANLVHKFSYCVYFLSLHVSGDSVPIITVWITVWYAGCNLHTRQSSTQSNKYQVWHRYSYFSWWLAHSFPKHVEIRNKHNKKICVPSWLYLQRLYKDARSTKHKTLGTLA